MGRTPFADSLFESDDDAVHVQRAMELTETLAFRSREFQTLSGGEKQSVILAAALAQTPSALLLDEPTTFLDLQHQIDLYRLLKKLADGGMLVVTITHDLNLASTFADRVVVMQRGECVADGPPSDVFRPKTPSGRISCKRRNHAIAGRTSLDALWCLNGALRRRAACGSSLRCRR